MVLNNIEGVLSGAQQLNDIKSMQQSTGGFSNVLSQALESIKETEAEAETANEALLTGESDDLHTALIAAQKAEVAVSLAVEVRDRVLEAYNTILGMQV
jgi:flagellar hook-basal body complex protein FliE